VRAAQRPLEDGAAEEQNGCKPQNRGKESAEIKNWNNSGRNEDN
jgi:hypothetical protein